MMAFGPMRASLSMASSDQPSATAAELAALRQSRPDLAPDVDYKGTAGASAAAPVPAAVAEG